MSGGGRQGAPDGYRIEAALPEHVPALASIEIAAASIVPRAFAAPELLEESLEPALLERAVRDGRLFVAIEKASGAPVGFAVLVELGGHAHLHEIDVLPAHARRGLGAALVETGFAWARAHGFDRITLTTFRELAWNEPFYARMGFEPVERAEMGEALAAQFDREVENGLDPARRVAMRRRL